MEFERDLYIYLTNWKNREDRMPLLLRGARQVGKTTLIRQFAKEFDVFLEFNLEKQKDRAPFEQLDDIDDLVSALFLLRDQTFNKFKTHLLFIDEIQEWSPAINKLRYLYEEWPMIHVVATGSLMDHALNEGQRIPVGRVEYAVLHPMNFSEYLVARDKKMLKDRFLEMPIPNIAMTPLYEEFHKYVLLGGMPKIISSFLQNKPDIAGLKPIFHGLLRGYREDVEKYAKNRTEVQVIRHIINMAPLFADQRIKFQKFGNSEYRAREVGEAFRSLEKARIVDLIYPTVETSPPLIPDMDKRPRLQYLDTGLMNYVLNNQFDVLRLSDLNDVSRGKIAQHIVYQEVKSMSIDPDFKNAFWVRQERRSQAEVDLVVPWNNYLIPIEIKSGASGKLRSLHEFIDRCDHNYAIRMYKGPLKVDELKTRKGKKYFLLNMPYFLGTQLDAYVDWFVNHE